MTSKYTLGSNQHKKTPKTRIIHNNKVIARFNCDGKKLTRMQALYAWFIKWTKRVALVSFSLGVITASYHVGTSTATPRIVQAQTLVPTLPSTISAYPILERIADCESGQRKSNGKAVQNSATQYAPNGQVLTNPNSNHSVDIGIMQINLSAYGKTATTLGYDLTTKQGNEAMGLWIYENRGTEDWYSSKSCWQ